MIQFEFDDARIDDLSAIRFTTQLIEAVDNYCLIREVTDYLKLYCHYIEKKEEEKKFFESTVR